MAGCRTRAGFAKRRSPTEDTPPADAAPEKPATAPQSDAQPATGATEASVEPTEALPVAVTVSEPGKAAPATVPESLVTAKQSGEEPLAEAAAVEKGLVSGPKAKKRRSSSRLGPEGSNRPVEKTEEGTVVPKPATKRRSGR